MVCNFLKTNTLQIMQIITIPKQGTICGFSVFFFFFFQMSWKLEYF